MIARAQANADRAAGDHDRRPTFRVGDLAAPPFTDRSLDLIVSTPSMHHRAYLAAGLAEIGWVRAPGGRARKRDFRADDSHPTPTTRPIRSGKRVAPRCVW